MSKKQLIRLCKCGRSKDKYARNRNLMHSHSRIQVLKGSKHLI